MATSTFNQIALIASFVLSGCSGASPVSTSLTTGEIEATMIPIFSVTDTALNDVNFTNTAINDAIYTNSALIDVVELALNDENNTTITGEIIDPATIQRFRIASYKVECQGFHLTQCLLNTPNGQADAEFFYDSIEGFEFEWGYEYELLVSVTTDRSQLGDRFKLVEIVSQSEYHHQQTFEYVARYATESIVNVAPGEYRLAGNQTMVCEAAVCESIESALVQAQSVLLDLQYGEQPGDALQLVALVCAESRSSFNTACL